MESSAHHLHLPIDIRPTESVPISPQPMYPNPVFLTGPLETEVPEDATNEDPADGDGGLGVDSFIHRITSDFFFLRPAGSSGLPSFAPQFSVDSLYTTEQARFSILLTRVASILQTAPHFVLEGAGNMAYAASRAELDFYRQENRRLHQMLERSLTNSNTLFRAHGWIHLEQALSNEFASANWSQHGGTNTAASAQFPASYYNGAESAGFHASVHFNNADMTYSGTSFASDSRDNTADNAADNSASSTGYSSAARSTSSGYGTTVDSGGAPSTYGHGDITASSADQGLGGISAVGTSVPGAVSERAIQILFQNNACGCVQVSIAVETKHGHKFHVWNRSAGYYEHTSARYYEHTPHSRSPNLIRRSSEVPNIHALSAGNATIKTSLGSNRLQGLTAEHADVGTSMGLIERSHNASDTRNDDDESPSGDMFTFLCQHPSSSSPFASFKSFKGKLNFERRRAQLQRNAHVELNPTLARRAPASIDATRPLEKDASGMRSTGQWGLGLARGAVGWFEEWMVCGKVGSRLHWTVTPSDRPEHLGSSWTNYTLTADYSALHRRRRQVEAARRPPQSPPHLPCTPAWWRVPPPGSATPRSRCVALRWDGSSRAARPLRSRRWAGEIDCKPFSTPCAWTEKSESGVGRHHTDGIVRHTDGACAGCPTVRRFIVSVASTPTPSALHVLLRLLQMRACLTAGPRHVGRDVTRTGSKKNPNSSWRKTSLRFAIEFNNPDRSPPTKVLNDP
ncbi:hypothetical protein C8R43DRAFT_941565 [Mycena crocata]|nr:hypothetical protein C8R43DRAFT_941565 [Mycena crocata]